MMITCCLIDHLAHSRQQRSKPMSLKRIPLDLIVANPNQPRQESFGIETGELQELADSIARQGLIQAITVRPIDANEAAATGLPAARFMIVAGERRWRAHKLLAEQGRKIKDGDAVVDSILANVRRMDVDQMDIAAIIENARRKDIKPVEEARAFKRMIDRGWSAEAIAKEVGLSQVFRVAERVQLLSLQPDYLKLLDAGQINETVGYYVSKLEPFQQDIVMSKIASGAVSGVPAIRAMCQALADGGAQADIFGSAAPKVAPKDIATVNQMEAKIIRIEQMVAAGWKDNECVTAVRVDKSRAVLMADKLAAIRKAIGLMERDLRATQGQAELSISTDTSASIAA
jgi:ParB family transcriptional regulator, chromosome partitioning protein